MSAVVQATEGVAPPDFETWIPGLLHGERGTHFLSLDRPMMLQRADWDELASEDKAETQRLPRATQLGKGPDCNPSTGKQ